jgi:hypothetical protein
MRIVHGADPIVPAYYALRRGVPALQADPRRQRWLCCVAALVLAAAGGAVGYVLGRGAPAAGGDTHGVLHRR